jgi:cell division protein FtsI (penicillin-binding protein 3)
MSILRNRATIDVFEPGSVLKPLAMSAILESGKIHEDLIVNTSPGWIEFEGYKTSDFRDYGRLNLSEIISYSSNVGMIKLCEDQDIKHLVNYYKKIWYRQISYVYYAARKRRLFTSRNSIYFKR